jgi:hypothetical protein
MTFELFVEKRKDELGMSYADVARELTLAGYSVSKQLVHSWVKGTKKPDVRDGKTRTALCSVFRIDEVSLFALFDIHIKTQPSSPEARYAAQLIDSMPDEKRKMAIGILEQIRE